MERREGSRGSNKLGVTTMERSRKKELVAELKQQFAEAKLVVVAQYSSLSMSEINVLRSNMREAGARFTFTKNTLAKLAVVDSDFAYLAEHFTGQTGVAFSYDEISAAKVLHRYSKENNKITLVAGGTPQASMTAADIQALASLPSLDELRGKLVGLMQGPAIKVAGVLQAPAGQLARVMGAYASKDAA